MIPFQDNIPSRRFPVLTMALIVVNALVYLFEATLGPVPRERFVYRFALIPREFQLIGAGPTAVPVPVREIVRSGEVLVVRPALELMEFEGTWLGAVVPLITSMFLHGNWSHLLGNMWFLWLFGDNVEDRLGRGRFVVLYLLGGLVAGAVQVVVNWGDSTPIIGASGAVAGVLGAYMISYPYARIRTLVPFFFFFWPVVELPAFVFLGLWLLLQFFNGAMSVMDAVATNVAWWAHVGGFIAGIGLMKLLAPEFDARRGPSYRELFEGLD